MELLALQVPLDFPDLRERRGEPERPERPETRDLRARLARPAPLEVSEQRVLLDRQALRVRVDLQVPWGPQVPLEEQDPLVPLVRLVRLE